MKFYLKKVVVGFFFGVGMFTAFLLMDEIRSEIKRKESLKMQKLEAAEYAQKRVTNKLDASKVVVTNTRLVRLARNISVAVQIENRLDEAFATASIVIKFYDETGLLGQCQRSLPSFKSKQIKELVVQCGDYSSANFPENIVLKANVEHVQKDGYGL